MRAKGKHKERKTKLTGIRNAWRSNFKRNLFWNQKLVNKVIQQIISIKWNIYKIQTPSLQETTSLQDNINFK